MENDDLKFEEYFNETQDMLKRMTAEEFFNMFGINIEDLPEK